MKKVTTVFVILLMLFISNTASAEEVTLTGALSVLSKYIGKSGVELSTDPVIQGSVTIGYKDFYFVTWGSSGFNKWNSSFDDEIDITLGKIFVIKKLTVDLSINYYVCYDFDIRRDDLYGFVGIVSYEGGLNPYLYVENDKYVDSDFRGGTFYVLGIKPGVIEINISGHNGAFGTNSEMVEKIGIGLNKSFYLENGLKLTPKINYSYSLGDGTSKNGLTDSKFWAGISMTW
jgi:hypothetical protein